MELFQLFLILGTIHSGVLFDIRDAFKINWRFHGGHIPHHEESVHSDNLVKSTSIAEAHQGEVHHDGHWIPPKLKVGVNFGIVGGKWPFFWSWKPKHHHVAEHDTKPYAQNSINNPSKAHSSSGSSSISFHPTNQISIKSKAPQLESSDTGGGVPLSNFISLNSLSMNPQTPPRLNSHAERIIRNFGIPQNHVVHLHTPPPNPNVHHSESLSSFETPNLHNYHHNTQHDLDTFTTAPGNIFPTGGDSFTQPYNSHQRMQLQSLPEIIQPSSTNNLPVAKALPIISHPNNLKYSTIHSTQQQKLGQNLVVEPSESKHLTSLLASANYPNANCYNCYIPYTRGSLAHALVNDIQNLPISDDNKLVKALQVILAIAQEDARQRQEYLQEQKFMRKR